MSGISVAHFLYGPTPKKGYSKRAVSPDILPDEYERLIGCYVPFDPVYLRSDDAAGKEARAVVSVPENEVVFFSRLFRGHKLDEKGRSGILSHTAAIPRKAFIDGLAFSEVDAAMARFEAENGLPVGEMQKIEIEWKGDQSDAEKSKARVLMSKDSLRRLIEGYKTERDVRFVVTCRGAQPKERGILGYALSRLLDFELGLVPVSFLTEPPLDLHNAFFNLVLVHIPMQVPPRIGWRTLEAHGAGSADASADIDEDRIKKAIESW